jgi:hypothetical protein
MPLSISRSNTSGESLAGPIVHTIFARRMARIVTEVRAAAILTEIAETG